MASPTGKGLLGPDGLAMRGLAGPPALGEVGDKEQAASTFVEGACPAEVRGGAAAVRDFADERPVSDETELDRARSVPWGPLTYAPSRSLSAAGGPGLAWWRRRGSLLVSDEMCAVPGPRRRQMLEFS